MLFSKELEPIIKNMPECILVEMDYYVRGIFDLAFEEKDKSTLESTIQDNLYLYSSFRLKRFDIDERLNLDLYAPYAKEALNAISGRNIEDMNELKYVVVKYVWDCILDQIFLHYFVLYTLIPVDLYFIESNLGKRINELVALALEEKRKGNFNRGFYE